MGFVERRPQIRAALAALAPVLAEDLAVEFFLVVLGFGEAPDRLVEAGRADDQVVAGGAISIGVADAAEDLIVAVAAVEAALGPRVGVVLGLAKVPGFGQDAVDVDRLVHDGKQEASFREIVRVGLEDAALVPLGLGVEAHGADDHVVAVAAPDLVVAHAAEDGVVALAAGKVVVGPLIQVHRFGEGCAVVGPTIAFGIEL